VAVLITNRPNQVVVSSPGPQGPAGGGEGGGVTEVTGTAPISVATGTTTPVVSLDADGITTGKIADEAVTNGKIADLTIQTGKIADGAITAAKLADTSVTSITAGAGLTGGIVRIRSSRIRLRQDWHGDNFKMPRKSATGDIEFANRWR
jgi:hypothetical protein